MNAVSSFKDALKYILKDKVSFILALIPIIIGVLIFVVLGIEMYSRMQVLGNEYISQYLGDGTWGEIVYWIIKIILTVLLYYLINITFVMILSIIASPFNDMLSKRIEKQIMGEALPSFSELMKGSMSNLLSTLINESKKLVIILGISLLAVVIGFFPILTPISFLLSSVVLSTEFIDFSWSRHELTFKECRTDYRKNFFSYSFGGLFFMFLVSIPLVNVIVPAFGTSYFTVLWVRNNDRSSQITE